MKILLLNDNPVVNKLVTLSAQKTSDELDVVDSIDNLQSGEYDLLVVDDTMYNDDMFSEIKSKIMFSSSLYICARDAAKVEAFSSTLKKPFLPTDLVELFLMFAKKADSVDVVQESVSTDIDELEEFHTAEADEELILDEELELSLDDELEDLDDDLLLEDDDLNLDDELLLEDDELEDLDEELLLGDEDIEDGESVLDDEEAQKVKDLLDETSDNEDSQKIAEYDPQFAADELGLPVEEIEEFIQDFINQAYEFKDELYSSLESGDSDNIHALSHKIKGVAANLRMEEALDAISIVNESSDNAEVEASLDNFYKVVDKLAGVNTSSSSEEEDKILDELEEFSSEELELDEELSLEDDDLELDEELTLDEEEVTDLDELEELSSEELEPEEELSLEEDDLELDEELTLDEEVGDLEELEEELELDEEVNTSTSSEEEIATDLDELEEFSSEEPELENEFTFDEEEAEAAIDKAVTEEMALESDEDDLELDEELTLDEEEFDIDEEAEEAEEELDIETQIENAVEELSDEDLESELDEETLLEIATNEIDSVDAFDSLTSNDLKLAIGEEVIEEVNTEIPDLESFEETQAEEVVSEEVEANSIEALENLLAALKDNNVAASMKGMKININITIGDE